MRFDDYSFEDTAKAVWIMNESAQDMYDSFEELKQFMMSMAYQYGWDNTSFSTGGFQLTFTKSLADPSDIYCIASVSGFVASRYADAVADRMHQIKSVVDQLAA